MLIKNDLKQLAYKMKEYRRELHRIPELAFQEVKTSKYIADSLREIGVDFEEQVIGTGIIAHIKGREGKRTLAFRADMDALEIEEKNASDYISSHSGKMHACGHDGHMAMLIGLAAYLKENIHQLNDDVVLIFQPAEEGIGGAQPIVEKGFLKKYHVDEIYGIHIYPGIEEGKMGVKPGPMMSQTGEFDILIKGVSGHGAMPHTSIDSVVIAAQLISGLQTIVSRSINPIEPSVVTIGRVIAGERRNVIAGEAILEGTIRSFSQEVYDKIKQEMENYTKGLRLIHNCEISIIFRDMYPAVENDKYLTEELIKGQDPGVIEEIQPVMLAEDFSYYQKSVPGVFLFLGSGSKEFNHSLHNNRFNFNEDILAFGLNAYINILKQRGALEK
ncbi:M20 metallopeptidase family protein [Alkaliphilus serpentinus]|uniref:Amidohydrolase n=1 Tax=Alkaliphilus serpentinus TaxID=1482731 RepID=A0A833HNL5_9FIRM|nr:M20 family metallopeptidase [Alkaliphilus serpentinus]KAB3529829.1 amidohydrolase [Alkaliphilus serpentinus]